MPIPGSVEHDAGGGSPCGGGGGGTPHLVFGLFCFGSTWSRRKWGWHSCVGVHGDGRFRRAVRIREIRALPTMTEERGRVGVVLAFDRLRRQGGAGAVHVMVPAAHPAETSDPHTPQKFVSALMYGGGGGGGGRDDSGWGCTFG